MMMCDLPLELVEEILSRVPATSLKRLRSTCKRWNALFKDQRFSEKHFLKAPKESKVLILKEYKVFSMSVNFNVAPPSIEFKAGGLKASHFNIGAVFHCDGLLLCITLDNRAVVWNPCLGETRWIQCKSSSYSRFALGYEKEKSGHSYKILMYRESHNDIPRKRANGFEIYEFSSDSWRLLDNVALDCTPPSNIVVSLKGNSYWLAYDKKEKYNHFLLCFDFTAERFKRMCLPPSDVDQMSLSVVGEKQLSVLALSNSTSEMEIWITNKIDTDIEVELKWSKSFAVDIPNDCCVYYPRGLSFLIDEEKKVALCCYRSVEIGKNIASIIGEDDEYYREILDEYSKFSWFPYIFSYIPSLVQIQLS